jgi:hypothetical protein
MAWRTLFAGVAVVGMAVGVAGYFGARRGSDSGRFDCRPPDCLPLTMPVGWSKLSADQKRRVLSEALTRLQAGGDTGTDKLGVSQPEIRRSPDLEPDALKTRG